MSGFFQLKTQKCTNVSLGGNIFFTLFKQLYLVFLSCRNVCIFTISKHEFEFSTILWIKVLWQDFLNRCYNCIAIWYYRLEFWHSKRKVVSKILFIKYIYTFFFFFLNMASFFGLYSSLHILHVCSMRTSIIMNTTSYFLSMSERFFLGTF